MSELQNIDLSNIVELIAAGVLLFLGWGKLRLQQGETLLDDYKETKAERDKAQQNVETLHQELGIVRGELEKLKNDYLNMQHEVSVLKSEKGVDKETIKNLNAQLADVPLMRKEISKLREEMNILIKSKETIAAELKDANERFTQANIEKLVIQGKYEEVTKNNLNMQNVIEAFTIIARQSTESVPKSEALTAGESTEAPVPDNQQSGIL